MGKLRRCRRRHRRRRSTSVGEYHLCTGAGVQHPLGDRCLGPVHRQIVLALDLHDPIHVPALVQGRQPFGQVLVDLLVSVHAGAGQGEVKQVVGEGAPGAAVGGAEAAIVRFAAGDDEKVEEEMEKSLHGRSSGCRYLENLAEAPCPISFGARNLVYA